MTIVKTEKGRDELAARSKAVGARARQILVLSNGLRSRSEMIGMMGSIATELIDSLIKDGYIIDADIPDVSQVPLDVLSRTGTFIKSPNGTLEPLNSKNAAKLGSLSSDPKSVDTSAPEQKVLPTKHSGRRSLAGTKMYTIDMLQLARNPESSAMAVSVHTSETADELISYVLASLALISRTSGPSYAINMALRLQTMIPEVYLPELLEQTTAIEESRAYN